MVDQAENRVPYSVAKGVGVALSLSFTLHWSYPCFRLLWLFPPLLKHVLSYLMGVLCQRIIPSRTRSAVAPGL